MKVPILAAASGLAFSSFLIVSPVFAQNSVRGERVDANGMGPDAARAMIPTEARQLPIADLHAEFVIRSRFIDEPVRRRVLICLSQATSYAHES